MIIVDGMTSLNTLEIRIKNQMMNIKEMSR